MLEPLAGSHVVVLGGAGFLGSHLCERLVGLGARVTAIDNGITGHADNIAALIGAPGFAFVKYDVTNYLHVAGHVDHVLHFASPASPADYLRWPIQTLKVGSLGTHKALGLARAKEARFLLASTSEVYGDPLVNPQPESYWGNVNPVGPRGVYDEAKRFSEAMALAYHRQHGVDVRIARIFNSILADEQVLYDDGRELRREAVGELARRVGTNVDLSGYTVPAFERDGHVVVAPAVALVGHPTRQRCYVVTTRYGRTIRVTGDHSVFVEGSSGLPTPRPVTRLRVGDRVALPARVNVRERDRPRVHLPHVWDAAGKDAWDLLVRAPGLGEVVWQHRDALLALLVQHGGRSSRRSLRDRVARDRDRNQLPLAAFRRLGLPLPLDARVRLRTAGWSAELPLVVAVTDEFLWLLGLFVAGGSWLGSRHDGYIAITSDEEVLTRAEKVIERELNLRVAWSKSSPPRAHSIFAHSRLLIALLGHLGFAAAEKRIPGWVLGLPLQRLKWFVEGYREGAGVRSGKRLVDGVRHEFSSTSPQLKDDLVVAFGRFGLVPSVRRYESTLKQRSGDRRSPFWTLTMCHVAPWSPLEWDAGVVQRLQSRRHGDLVWAAVKSIEETAATALVYDFSVPGYENFWAGGLAAHNTYGPRMRIDDGRAVPAFFAAALRGEPLPVFGDGQQTRSLCYVDDEVEGLLRLLVSEHVGPVNIGNPDETTVLELAEAVQDAVGNHPGVAFQPAPQDDPRVRRPDTALAERLLGWKAQVPLAEGLRRTAEWFRSKVT